MIFRVALQDSVAWRCGNHCEWNWLWSCVRGQRDRDGLLLPGQMLSRGTWRGQKWNWRTQIVLQGTFSLSFKRQHLCYETPAFWGSPCSPGWIGLKFGLSSRNHLRWVFLYFLRAIWFCRVMHSILTCALNYKQAVSVGNCDIFRNRCSSWWVRFCTRLVLLRIFIFRPG